MTVLTIFAKNSVSFGRYPTRRTLPFTTGTEVGYGTLRVCRKSSDGTVVLFAVTDSFILCFHSNSHRQMMR
jgi:hypothetical protein